MRHQATKPVATLSRMVMDKHVCPWGLKARHLLQKRGFRVDDHWLRTREETEAFKAEHGVETTPQTFIGGERVGGYHDLRRYFGLNIRDPEAPSYTPVIAVFATAAALALAASQAVHGTPLTVMTAEWFIAFAMMLLAMLKLQDVESRAPPRCRTGPYLRRCRRPGRRDRGSSATPASRWSPCRTAFLRPTPAGR